MLVLTIFVKIVNNTALGKTIRDLREKKGVPLRTVAASLRIDQAILSKIERGQRKATRVQVLKLAGYFKIKADDLLVAWLSDKIIYETRDEKVALKALHAAEEKVKYGSAFLKAKKNIINAIKAVLKNDKRVAAAWLFGSFARGDETAASDVDILVELSHDKKYSMFDLLDLSFAIEKKINRKVDLVEKGFIKEFAYKNALNDFIKIYG
jgi:predicted nucleotidyltransferase